MLLHLPGLFIMNPITVAHLTIALTSTSIILYATSIASMTLDVATIYGDVQNSTLLALHLIGQL